ncbi:hypothetical protein [Propionibacterium sp.]|uniref:hypothetical protein n=1 Tax=Propionibacterium sp. TaxID=1977903 RepID=UPI0039E75373
MVTATRDSLRGVTEHSNYADGTMSECTLSEPNVVHTACGDFVPHYSEPDVRTKDLKSMSFYPSGAVRTISLEQQTLVPTVLGALPAELVTFYETGELDSVFPLNGQISFSWSEAEERKLAKPFAFSFSFGEFTTTVINVRFYPTGEVKSLTMWPGESIKLKTPAGFYPCRAGLRLHPSGALASFEPAMPIAIRTPIGFVQAYDVDAFTMAGDQNSVRFDEDGHLTHVSTSGDILIESDASTTHRISSRTRLALSRDVPVKLAVEISFVGDHVLIDNGETQESIPLAGTKFMALPDIDTESLGSCDLGCESCSLGCA